MVRSPTHRRGVAMLLVLGVIAMAVVLGFAMLASASLQRQVSTNATATLGAQGMAESGVNLAMYYLQNPEKWREYPATYPETETYDRNAMYWTGTGGQFVEFGSGPIGWVKVSVTRPNEAIRWEYHIESVGRAAGSDVVRRVTATVWVNAEYKLRDAAVFANDVMLPAGVRAGQSGQANGDVYSNGALQIRAGGIVYGKGTRRKALFSAATPMQGWRSPVPAVPQVVPRTLAEIRNYRDYELPAGTLNHATVLSATAIGDGAAAQSLNDTPGNPAGVYYAPGDFTLKTNADVQGTLIVNGKLLIDGYNIRVRADAGFPALLVKGDIYFANASGASELTVEGLCWVGGKIDALAVTPTLNVTGALLISGTTPVFPMTTGGRLNLLFDSNRTVLPDFSDFGRTPKNVKVISWQGQ